MPSFVDRSGESKVVGSATLTLVRPFNTDKGRVKYVVNCSVCSSDEELWPEGSITTHWRDFFSKDRVPCGCNDTKVKWKEFQWEILVKRRCEQLGYVFMGWFGDFKGNLTRLRLHEPMQEYYWDTMTISNLVKGRKGTNFRITEDERVQRLYRVQDLGVKNLKFVGKNSGHQYLFRYECLKCNTLCSK